MDRSEFGRTFLFLSNLAWKSRITLPVLITAGFMILNFRWEVEINIHTERIAFQGVADGEGGGPAAMIDYSVDESWETTDSDEDDDDDYYDDDDDEDDDEEDDDTTDDEAGRNGIHINRIAVYSF